MQTLMKRSSRLSKSHCERDLTALKALCAQKSDQSRFVLASGIKSNIPIYDIPKFGVNDTSTVSRLQDEFHDVLHTGPGVCILQKMFQKKALLDEVNETFAKIVEAEKPSSRGDHFAASGKNDRIWNSFGKHCLQSPKSFVEYYSNPWLAIICESWLGPAYRVTAQCNIVKPGGSPQTSHRDYHLGFQTEATCAKYPRVTQIASQFLTLQGAIAHTDMPLESGPTRFLPYSQALEDGYMVYRQPEFDQYFLENWVSVPMETGDAVFFNPALFHAAGENQTQDVNRCANLIQVSSAFGEPMETVQTIPLIQSCWYQLLQKYQKSGMNIEMEAIIAALGEGYPFPTNLDRRPPAPGGLAPEDEQSLIKRHLIANSDIMSVTQALEDMHRDSSM